MMDSPVFARTAFGGKRSAKIEARVHDETKIDLTRKCHELGISESEYLAHLVEVSLYGVDFVLRRYERHTAAVLGKTGRESDKPNGKDD